MTYVHNRTNTYSSKITCILRLGRIADYRSVPKSEKAMGLKVESIFIASLKQTFLRCHSDMNAVLLRKTLNRAAKESG